MKIAVITGASSGLGKEFLLCVNERYPDLDEIWIVARRKERLMQLKEDINNKKIVPFPYDITKNDFYSDFESALKEKNAEIKILINNAGFGILGNVGETDAKLQGDIVDLNCRALTFLTSVALKYMKRGSFIVNVCSIASFCPNPRMTVYSSSKAYVRSFSKGVRFENKEKGINVLAVCPGPMNTEFLGVAGINGNSKAFDMLPYCDVKKVVRNSLIKAEKGQAVYTPTAFYKFYRFVAKITPSAIMMRIAKT